MVKHSRVAQCQVSGGAFGLGQHAWVFSTHYLLADVGFEFFPIHYLTPITFGLSVLIT